MPPKKKGDPPSKKTVEKKKEKVIEDKTFGLKNKKGKKQQQFIKNVTSQVKYGGTVSKEKLASMEYQTKKEKEQAKKENSELGSILKPVAVVQHVSKDADPKSVLCVFFKQGQCMKGDRCKFSHDLSLERKTEKRNLYVDSRDVTLENDTIDTWDENKLQEVVDKKHGSSEKNKPKTEIVCKHFLQAIEKGLYGWFWSCPNGGDKCIYRHALPPGFVFKKAKSENDEEGTITIEELVEQERNKLASSGKPLTKVTLETFLRWKERKLKEKQDKVAADLAKKKEAFKAGKTLGVSGREVFEFNPTLIMEDDEDTEGEVFVHHHNMDEASSEGVDLTGISMVTGISLATGGDELLGAVGGCEAGGQDVAIDEELFEQELIDDDLVDEDLFNEEVADMTINNDDNDDYKQ